MEYYLAKWKGGRERGRRREEKKKGKEREVKRTNKKC
jgi:hypothetical protein